MFRYEFHVWWHIIIKHNKIYIYGAVWVRGMPLKLVNVCVNAQASPTGTTMPRDPPYRKIAISITHSVSLSLSLCLSVSPPNISTVKFDNRYKPIDWDRARCI